MMTSLQKYCQREFSPQQFSGLQFFFDVDLKPYTYFRSGGLAECLLQFNSKEQLEIIASKLYQRGISFLPLGYGSNVLISDNGIKDKVVLLAAKNIYSYKGEKITFSAGTFLPKAQNICYDFHLQGFEFATGIPGSIGGAIKTNAGTKLGEISNALHSITVLEKGNYKTLYKSDLDLAYRFSNLTSEQFVLDATFKLENVSLGKINELKAKTKEYLQYRKDTQPLSQPSFGSCFKNPDVSQSSSHHSSCLPAKTAHYTAAKYIEVCGLKGLVSGDAMISEKHANFIINKGKATTQDALNLIDKIKTAVFPAV